MRYVLTYCDGFEYTHTVDVYNSWSEAKEGAARLLDAVNRAAVREGNRVLDRSENLDKYGTYAYSDDDDTEICIEKLEGLDSFIDGLGLDG